MQHEVKLKCGTTYQLSDLEEAGISYVPCTYERPLLQWGNHAKIKRQVKLSSFGKDVYGYKITSSMQGIQIFTGKPTYRYVEKRMWHLADVDIERKLIDEHPEVYEVILDAYKSATVNPCRIETKSGGMRLSGFYYYLAGKLSYRGKDGGMLLEIFSDMGLSRIDNRYSQREGSLLEIPTIDKSFLRHVVAEVGRVGTQDIVHTSQDRKQVGISTLNGLKIQWYDKIKGSKRYRESQMFQTEICPITGHTSNRPEIRFSLKPNGQIIGRCFNCGGEWVFFQGKEESLDE